MYCYRDYTMDYSRNYFVRDRIILTHINLLNSILYRHHLKVVSDRVLLLYKQKENTMTHNRDYVFSQDNVQTVGDFVNGLSVIPRYEGVRLVTVKDRDGKTEHFEIDASLCTGEKWIVRDVNDCLHLVCSDAYILGMMFDYHYVIFKP